MNSSDKKKFLESYKFAVEFLPQYIEALKRIRAERSAALAHIERPLMLHSLIYDGLPKGTGDHAERLARMADKKAAIDSKYDKMIFYYKREIRRLRKIIKTVPEAVAAVEDPKLKKLLEDKYIKFMTWQEVAQGLNYSVDNVSHRLIKKALEALPID